jgi:hypothetical protein
MIAFSLLCVVALLLLIGIATAACFCYKAQTQDGQLGFGILTVIFIIGFVVCTVQAVMRADAIDREPQHIEKR